MTKSKAAYPLKINTKIYVTTREQNKNPGQLTSWNKTGQSTSSEECTLKTRTTHILKQSRPQSLSPEECKLKPGKLTF
jgi:hypothetical protein